LREREQEGHVGVDAFGFQLLGGLNTFPSAGDLEQNTLASINTSL
jgi:hypothetical protein